jgi:hypothetical protein
MPQSNNQSTGSGTPLGRGPASSPAAPLIGEFCQMVTEGFDPHEDWERVTDNFFMHIEEHTELLKEYHALADVLGTTQLNSQIGRWIKLHYGLESVAFPMKPKSGLIKAYTSLRRI